MKFIAAIATVAFTLITGCTVASPNIGYEGVLVKKPLIFGHGGVDPDPVPTGLTFAAITTDVIYVCKQPIPVTEDFKDLMSKDGVPLEFDAQIILQVTDSVDLIKRFGENWYQGNIRSQFQNFVRQANRKYDSNDTAINTTAIDAIDAEVTNNVTEYLKSANIPVKLVKVTVGKAIPPDAIKHQRIETAQQEQRVHTEEQRKFAEDARRAAELSRAEADNAYRNAMSLSPEQFLELQAINMQRDVCSGGKCIYIAPGVKSSPIIDTK